LRIQRVVEGVAMQRFSTSWKRRSRRPRPELAWQQPLAVGHVRFDTSLCSRSAVTAEVTLDERRSTSSPIKAA
jgi:hypothetical protein